MDITQDFADAKFMITGYDQECVMINNTPHHHSVLVSSDILISPWQVKNISDLNESNLNEIFQHQPEIAIIGTGKNLVLPEPKIIALFSQYGIGLETMNTSAACRTYGILIAEGRKTMAGIIFPDN